MLIVLDNKLIRLEEKMAYIFLSSMLPISFTLIWLFINTQLAGNDAANYMMTAIDSYNYFTDHGFVRGLWHFYTDRGWRPILFPNLAVPFLLISRGNMYFAYASVAFSCIFLSSTYIYLYSRFILNRYSSIVVANIIGLLPLMQAQILMFYAESALFVCLLACIYHLIKSNYLIYKIHVVAFVCFLSLALMIRPVEAVTDLIFVFLLFLTMGIYKGIFNYQHILKLVFISFFSITLFLLIAIKPYFHYTMIPIIDNGGPLDIKMAKTLRHFLKFMMCSTVLSTLLLYKLNKSHITLYIKSYSNKTLLLPAITGVIFLTFAWFLPAGFEMFQWIYRTSIGDVASSTGSLNGSRLTWEVAHKYILDEGQGIIISILFLVSITLISLKIKKFKSILIAPILYLLFTLPFPVWESFYTVQVVTRKLSFVFPAFLMTLLMVILHDGKLWRLRFSLCIGIVFFQGFFLSNIYFFDHNLFSKTWSDALIGNFIPIPSTILPNPHNVVISFFDEQVNQYHLHNIGLEVKTGTPDARNFRETVPIDPFLLSTMLIAERKKYTTSYPYFSTYSEENFENLSQKYDAIFVTDKITDMKSSKLNIEQYQKKWLNELSPSLKVYYSLLHHYASNKLGDIGWKLGPCLVMQTQKYGKYQGCLLLAYSIG